MNVLLWMPGFASGFLMLLTYALCKVSGEVSRREEDYGLI